MVENFIYLTGIEKTKTNFMKHIKKQNFVISLQRVPPVLMQKV